MAKDDVTVTDDVRTTKFLLEKGANVISCSHFGRPKGKVAETETGKNGRLTPVIEPLKALLGPGTDVKKVDDCIGKAAKFAAKQLTKGEVLLMDRDFTRAK